MDQDSSMFTRKNFVHYVKDNMNNLLYTSILILIFIAETTFAQNYGQVPYNENDAIEITLNGVTTLIYPDLEKPKTNFWYEPGELRIQRKKEGGRSRLSFTMEVHPSSDVSNGSQQVSYLTVNMVIDASYSAEYKKNVKRKLVDLGRTIVDPFKPNESYKLVNLKPIPSKVINIVLQEIFVMAEWVNKDYFFNKQVTLDKPFPLQLKLNHYDATILLESLLQKRIHRVGRIEYGEKQHIPLYLSIGLDESENPIDFAQELTNGSWQVVFSNPTEHTIFLERFRYFSRNRDAWITQSVNRLLPPFSIQMSRAEVCYIQLDEKPEEIRDIQWSVDYDYNSILKQYIKNIMPEPPAQIHVIFNVQHHANIKRLVSLFDSINIEVELEDKIGFEHRRLFKLNEEIFTTFKLFKQSFSMNSFGGVNRIRYRIEGYSKYFSSSYISRWTQYSEDFLGDNIYIDLHQNFSKLLNLDGNEPLDEAQIINEVYVLPHKKGDLNQTLIIPNSLRVVNTESKMPKVELRYALNQLKGYIELYLPIFPNTLRKVNNLAETKNIIIARLKRAEISFLADNIVIMDKVDLIPDGLGHLRLRFSVEGNQSKQVLKSIKNNPNSSIFLIKLHWAANNNRFSTTSIHFPLGENN